MKKYYIENIDIINTAEALFIQSNENSLLEIDGEYKNDIVACIQSIQNNEEIEGNYDIDLIEWLIQHDIIREISSKKLPIRLGILGAIDEKVGHEICRHLHTHEVTYTCAFVAENFEEQHKNIEIEALLIVGKVIAKFEQMLVINSHYFFKDVSIIYADFQKNSIDFGPILKKNMGTPCLESFVKRKIANLDNPNEYLTVCQNLQKRGEVLNLSKINFKDEKGSILLNFLKRELALYFLHELTDLLGTLCTLYFNNLEIEKNKIVKVQNLSYEDYATLRPFD